MFSLAERLTVLQRQIPGTIYLVRGIALLLEFVLCGAPQTTSGVNAT